MNDLLHADIDDIIDADRGKHVDDGEWIVGNFVYDFGHRRYYVFRNEVGVYNAGFKPRRESYCLVSYEVFPETIGQFTGLTDKNGKMIFENDIIVCSKYIDGNWVDRLIESGYVEKKFGAFGLHRKQGYYRPFKDWLEDYEFEVIGNIFDNPELLESEE